MQEDKPCIFEVNENLNLVEEGKPLNLPLAYLNKSCQFKKKYDILMNLKYGRVNKEYYKEYNKRPEVKEYKKEYNKRPEVKEYKKEYNKRPEVKEYKKEYYKRPEVKEYYKEYYKEYNKRPEVKEYKKEYNKKNKDKFIKNK